MMGTATPLSAALSQQNQLGYVTSATARCAVDSYALTSQRLDVMVDGGLVLDQSAKPAASFLIRGTSAEPDQDLFIGVGPQADVARYLVDVQHTKLTGIRLNPFQPTYRDTAGSAAPGPPGQQNFWVVSAQGPGTQQVEVDLRRGSWVVVIMNGDGSRPVAVDLQAGVRSDLLAPVAVGSLVAGLLLLTVGASLIVASASGFARSRVPRGPRRLLFAGATRSS